MSKRLDAPDLSTEGGCNGKPGDFRGDRFIRRGRISILSSASSGPDWRRIAVEPDFPSRQEPRRRQQDAHQRALTRLAGNLQAAAMKFGQALCKRKSEAGALMPPRQ